ncbi:MAG: glutamate--tRNA ligase [Bryobacter sp.]
MSSQTPRVRFAPSPTGYLHIGSARTFIFNWLYARQQQGTMILRIDDTDLERNTEASLRSIFDGLSWLGLAWDEQYRQSERLDLHRRLAWSLFEQGFAYRDFTPAQPAEEASEGETVGWLFNEAARNMEREESDRRAAAGEPFVLRFRVPRDAPRTVSFVDAVYGEQSKEAKDIEDFALLRSSGMPTYHMASCADDADLRITHIIRGQDHLTNTFKHVLLFEALGFGAMGFGAPRFAHLPLLVAPDGAKLSKRKHGPVVSVMTYAEAGFLPHGYINFLCLLGWNPKDNREVLSREELVQLFRFEGVNRSNAVVNFTDADPIDPKALWLNAQHLRSMPVAELTPLVRAVIEKAGLPIPQDEASFPNVVDTLRARYSTLEDFVRLGRPYFAEDFAMEDTALEKLNAPQARELLRELGARLEAASEYTEASIEVELRKLAAERGVKPGLLINGSRAALTGQAVGPSAFALYTCVGRERAIRRLKAV